MLQLGQKAKLINTGSKILDNLEVTVLGFYGGESSVICLFNRGQPSEDYGLAIVISEFCVDAKLI